MEAGEAKRGFDDAEDGFDGLFSAGVAGFGIGDVEFGLHGEAPRLGDAAGSLMLGWRPEVVSAMWLGAADGDQRLDPSSL